VKLFRLGRRRNLSPSWTYTVDGVIWRLLPTRTGQLVGEERDLVGKKASFFCLDQFTGKALWQKAAGDEPWWIGMEAVHRDILVLHSFLTPDLPVHKGIIALDLMSGKQLWANNELRFVAGAGQSIFGAKETLAGSTIQEVHFRTGALVQEWVGEAGESRIRELLAGGVEDETIALPHPVTDLETSFPRIAGREHRHERAEQTVGTVDVLEYGERTLVWSAHETVGGEQVTGRMNTVLRVADRLSGKTLLETVLNSNVQARVPVSFFVQADMLYYVKERKELAAVQLRELPGGR